MAKHIVKCFYCGAEFDCNVEPYEMATVRRYAHLKCHQEAQENLLKEEKDKVQLEDYIKTVFNIPKLTTKINNQIKQYKKENGYSYSAIYKTLLYWFNIKKKSVEKANNGIGIVPYIIQEASDYWKEITEARERNKEVDLSKINLPAKEVYIKTPKRQPMKYIKKQFSFLDEDDANE